MSVVYIRFSVGNTISEKKSTVNCKLENRTKVSFNSGNTSLSQVRENKLANKHFVFFLVL